MVSTDSGKRAVVYLRQSRDFAGDGLAVERQRADCVALCDARGWTVAHIVTDNSVSASKGVRPGWTEVLRLAESGAVDVIVGWHVDRLSRKLTELEHLIELSERTGVTVATVSGDLDLTTDPGRLVGRILSSVARGEVERKSARQKRSGLQSAQAGKWSTGNRPYGYTNTGEVIPGEAEVVRELFAKFNAGASLRSLVRWLNETTTGNRLGRPWKIENVRQILRNPRYAGIRTYHGEELGRGDWEPIIDEAVYRAAAATLADPARRSNKGTARKHLGSFRYRCGKCNRGLVAANYHGGHRVYRCQGCSHQRRADPIDDYVGEVVVARLRRDDLADLLAADAPDVGPLRERSRALRARLDVIADDYADGKLTGAQAQRATERVTRELGEVERRLADAGRASALAQLAAAPDPGAAWLAADVGTRGAVLDTLADVIILPVRPGPQPFDPESVRIEPRTP